MEHRISHKDMDELLKKLEDDYVEAVTGNESTTVEEFVHEFLMDSWEYNDRNIENIKAVMSRYSKGDIYKHTFSGAFNEMVDYVQDKLTSLDQEKEYPLIHQPYGASVMISFVDGLVIQYYTGCYDVEQLRNMTPQIKQIILNALKTEPTTPQ
ncbi:hypothetical protein [Halobacillus litoralis]|uniref:hypothetical protein n=1 Tax=Halobacillus litoralis TaxID=45668 RepID=UPI001CFF1FFB|nr:hypothetical protein [Halobacillus litoralis]